MLVLAATGADAQQTLATTPPSPPPETEPEPPAGEPLLNEKAILSLAIASVCLHVLAELLGVDACGYVTMQLGIALATRPCARPDMRATFDKALWVLLPAREWMNEGDYVPAIAPAVVFAGSVIIHYLLTLLVGAVASACCRDQTSDGDDEGADGAAAEPRDDPYGGGFWRLGKRLLRWPFWSVTLVRVNLVPCVAYAMLQLGRGSHRPPGKLDAASDGVTAGGIVLACAVIVTIVGSLVLTYRFTEKMQPKWIFYGGSRAPERRDPQALACSGVLAAPGFWSDHGRHLSGAAVAAASDSRPRIVFVSAGVPLIALVAAAFIGGPWYLVSDMDSDTCIAPAAVTASAATFALAIPLLVARPYRHVVVNLFGAARAIALTLFAFIRIVPDGDMPDDAFTGIFIAVEVVTALLTCMLGLLERLVWRPSEADLRTVRLQYVLLCARAAARTRAIEAEAQGKPGFDEVKRRCDSFIAQIPSLPPSRLAELAPDEAQSVVDIRWREGDAPTETVVFDARARAAALTADGPALAVPEPVGNRPRGHTDGGGAHEGNTDNADGTQSPNPLERSGLSRSVNPASPTNIEFSPSSPHPIIPRREGDRRSLSNGAVANAIRGDMDSRRPSGSVPPGTEAQRGQQQQPLPGDGDPNVESLFVEMDLLTAALSKFPTEPAPATRERLPDPFDVTDFSPTASLRGVSSQRAPSLRLATAHEDADGDDGHGDRAFSFRRVDSEASARGIEAMLPRDSGAYDNVTAPRASEPRDAFVSGDHGGGGPSDDERLHRQASALRSPHSPRAERGLSVRFDDFRLPPEAPLATTQRPPWDDRLVPPTSGGAEPRNYGGEDEQQPSPLSRNVDSLPRRRFGGGGGGGAAYEDDPDL